MLIIKSVRHITARIETINSNKEAYWKVEADGIETVLEYTYMTKMANAQVTISYAAWCVIGKDIAQRPKIEACGVLFGTIDEQGNWYAAQAQPLRNIFSSPSYFEFDPEELLTIELTHSEQIIGVYHSHPTGFARASGTDRENMQRVNQQQQIPWVWLIACGPFDNLLAQQERTPSLAMIAYHHYAQEGLCKIRIQREVPDTLSEETLEQDANLK